jgi:hypothetical protein
MVMVMVADKRPERRRYKVAVNGKGMGNGSSG